MEDRPKRKRGRPAKRSQVLREKIDEDKVKHSYSLEETPEDSTPPVAGPWSGQRGLVSPTLPPEFDTVFDIATLGTRTETCMVEKPVVVGQTDLGKDIITMKMLPVVVTKLQPILNLEEAMSLGKRDWQPFPPKEGYWFCKVEQKGQQRRFLIPEDVYEKVKDV